MQSINTIFLTRLYYPHIGGVEEHVEKLATELKKSNFEPIIVTEQFNKHIREKQIINGIQIVRIPYEITKTKLGIWQWFWQHQDLINQTDLVHAHDVFWWYFPFRFIFNKPIFTTFHGYEGSQPPRWQAIVHRKLAEKLSRGSVCIGDFMRTWYHAHPNFVSYGAADLKPSSIPHPNIAIFIGRLDLDTGIMAYLLGLSLFKNPPKLTVIGDGPLRRQAKKFVTSHHLPVVFKETNLHARNQIKNFRYAFVSRYLGILEAMQTKRLVFAHYNNAIKKDYLTCHPQAKNMIIFNTGPELVQKITSLSAQEEKDKVNAAYSWAKHQTWEKLASQYRNLWKKSL